MIERTLQPLYRRLFKPHFWRLWTADRRALPDYLIIGSMRSGTTSLYDYISRHPGIAPAIKKEVHYFDLEFSRGERWYRAHFHTRENLERTVRQTGEATPYYLSHPLAAVRARELLPNAKLIVVLRHPVDRAYSHYWHSVRNRLEPKSFEAALEAEPERLDGELQRMEKDGNYHSFTYQHHAYTTRSMYAVDLGRWLAQFPREQVLVLEQSRLKHDFQAQSDRLFTFLALDAHPQDSQTRLNRADYPAMQPETRRKLLDFFEPHNRQLFSLLGETFDWQD